MNEGALVTATADSSLYLWNFRQKRPEVVHSLKFQREKITYIHLPLQSKWLYVGTERGNIHVVNIESFVLSGYVINWNKAIEVSRKTHPGPVVHLSDNPLDASKLLIAYKTGQIVLWDLRTKVAELRCQSTEELLSISWHHEGKQFMCSHTDGSLTTWSTRQAPKPFNLSIPHAKANKDGKMDPCKPIQKVEWKCSRSGEAYVIFSGGLTYDKAGRTPSITVINGKTTTVLEMEHNVVDFITLCDSPYTSDFQDPYAIVVLLHNDLVVIDLLSPGYPCFENPYPMDLHESPVTCCTYLADCPSDLIPAFYSVGSRSQKRQGFSEREWPLCGGEWSPTSCSYNEIIITGHADGSLKFWDASAGTLQVLYKLKTAKVFEKPRAKSVDGVSDDPFAIQLISVCPESRKLCIAGASSHVILFKFKKHEAVTDTAALDIPIIYDIHEEGDCSPEYEYPPRPSLTGRIDLGDGENKKDGTTPLKVRAGPQKKPPGFQAHLVCLTPYHNGQQPSPISALVINSSLGLMAYGNEVGIAVVDIVQKVCVLNMGTPDLYGSADPYQRVPRSPKRGQGGEGKDSDDRCRSPTNDQPPARPLEPPIAPSVAISLSSPGQSSLDDNTFATMENFDERGYYSDVTPQANSPDIEVGEEAFSNLQEGTVLQESSEKLEESVKPSCDQGRRKSTSWKGFNLKKQLSKVDQRLKKYSLPAGPSSHPNLKKRNSLFYYTSADAACSSQFDSLSPSASNISPSSDDGKMLGEEGSGILEGECTKEISKQVTADAVSEDGTQCNKEVNKDSAPKKMEDIVVEAMNNQLNRPSDLPLFDEEGRPVRPPRRDPAKRKWPEKRDVRLLSVPNIKYQKPEHLLRDLRNKGENSSSNQASLGSLMKRLNKLDSSFSRSRSSSMSSLENITSESIQCLVFTDSYTKKSDPSLLPTLWVGTSLGSVLTIMVNLPPSGESRRSQPIITSPCGTIFRLKGSILTIAFLDCNGALIPYSYEPWRDENKEARERIKTPTKSNSPTHSGGSGQDFGDRQFVVFTSEKQARVVALPSHNCVYRQQLADTDFVVKSEVIAFKDSVCLVCYISSGNMTAYTLPSLRQLINIDFLPLADLSFQTSKQGIVDPMLSIWGQQMFVNEDTDQIARTFCFSNRGHGLYLCSSTEVQKFTTSAEFCTSLTEMVGELFLPHEMPEPPKESFFKSVFGGGARTLDREELFGEASGRASRSVAKHIPGPQANMESLNTRATTAAGEISRAHMMVVERGEKLGQLEDTTEKMMTEAESFAASAHNLMLKQKDKKWYQL